MSHHVQLALTPFAHFGEPRTNESPFCLCRQPEIQQPSSTVEFGEGGRDLALPVDFEDIDALDLLGAAGATDGDPAPSDFVAAVEDIQGLESERGLFGGAGDESRNAREGS